MDDFERLVETETRIFLKAMIKAGNLKKGQEDVYESYFLRRLKLVIENRLAELETNE